MSTPEKNKALVRLYFQRIDEGDLSVVDEFVAPDFVDHSPARGFPPDRDGLKRAAMRFVRGMPDAYHRVEEVIAEGDRVVARIRGYGTHTGEFAGVPATGLMVTAVGMVVLRIEAGKIAERWNVVDNLGLLQQLGAEVSVPRPAADGTAPSA